MTVALTAFYMFRLLFLTFHGESRLDPEVHVHREMPVMSWPLAVLAVGVMISLTWIDQRIADAWLALTGDEPGLLLGGTVIGLLLAYFARFLAVAFGPVEAALERIRPSIRDAARSLGITPRALNYRIKKLGITHSRWRKNR